MGDGGLIFIIYYTDESEKLAYYERKILPIETIYVERII